MGRAEDPVGGRFDAAGGRLGSDHACERLVFFHQGAENALYIVGNRRCHDAVPIVRRLTRSTLRKDPGAGGFCSFEGWVRNLNEGRTVERLEYDDENGVRKASLVAQKGEGVDGLAFFSHTDTGGVSGEV